MPEWASLHDDLTGAAAIRAAYRRRMAIRWRHKPSRDEDAKAGRLPHDWHAWMGCPSEAYQGYGCICDSWYERRSPKRFVGLKLLHREEFNAPVWTQTIDCLSLDDSLCCHGISAAPDLGLVVVSISGARLHGSEDSSLSACAHQHWHSVPQVLVSGGRGRRLVLHPSHRAHSQKRNGSYRGDLAGGGSAMLQVRGYAACLA